MVLELDNLIHACGDPELKAMLEKMCQKLEGYQEEAVASDAIVLATVLNPRFRTRFFDANYPHEAARAKKLFQHAFEESLARWVEDDLINSTPDKENTQTTPSPPSLISSNASCSQFDIFTTQVKPRSSSD
jgi:hypothetical protein